MAMVTLTPACSSTRPLPDNITHLRDASFSSSLNTGNETFKQKLADTSNRKPSPAPHDHLLVYPDGKKPEDGEIGVFKAEKYFNGAIDEDENPKISSNGGPVIHHQCTKTELVDIPSLNTPRSVQPGTPSIRSDSSWNSHSLLLQRAHRNDHNNNNRSPQTKPSKTHLKSLLASLSCNCSCNDKNSVEIDDRSKKNGSCKAVQAIKSTPNTADLVQSNKSQLNPWLIGEIQCRKIDQTGRGFNHEDCFSFPVLSSRTGNLKAKEKEDNIQRKSLEVLGSPVQGMAKKLLGPDRRLIASTWASTSQSLEDVQIRPNLDGTYDDTGSDASSDLFEIESFSTNTNSNSLLIRQGSDGMLAGGYAPSEASIEWSVVTAASATDFSAPSDSEDLRTFSFRSNVKKLVPPAKEVETRRSGGILLGCKSYKAVRVAGDAYRVSEKSSVLNGSRRHHRPESYAPMTRFGAENEVAVFDDSRNGQLGFEAHSLSRCHSAHYSRIMYT